MGKLLRWSGESDKAKKDREVTDKASRSGYRSSLASVVIIYLRYQLRHPMTGTRGRQQLFATSHADRRIPRPLRTLFVIETQHLPASWFFRHVSRLGIEAYGK